MSGGREAALGVGERTHNSARHFAGGDNGATHRTGIADERGARIIPHLLGLSVAMCAMDVLPGLGGAGRTGLQLGAVSTAITGVTLLARRPDLLARAWHRRAALLLACVAVVALAAVSAMASARPIGAWLSVARDASALTLGIIALQVAEAWPSRRHVPGLWAAGVVGLLAALYLASLVVPALRPALFELGAHQHVGGLDRYRGTLGAPVACGNYLLVCVGFAQTLPRRLRALVSCAALMLCVSTWSFPTLAVPIVVIGWLVRRRWLRIALWSGWSAAALVVLMLNPLRIGVGESQWAIGELHPSYYASGMGPIHTPIDEVRLGPISFVYHPSHYTQVAVAGLDCAARNPWLGVGGLNFAVSCPVITMDSYGVWALRRGHNVYTTTAAERGALGSLALGLAILSLARRSRWRSAAAANGALLVAYLLCGMNGENWFLPNFMAWLGLSVDDSGRERGG